MLGKLVKYDLKWTYKLLIVFYILAIFFALVSRGLSLVDNSTIFSFLTQFSWGITISMIFNIVINNLMRLWVRLVNNVYKDESYLTHTLPVKKSDIYLSKVLAAFITLFTSALVIVASLLICFYSNDLLRIIKSMITDSVLVILIEVIVVVFLELLFLQILGYLAIIIGFRSNHNKIVKAIVYGFGLYMVSSIISVGILLIIGLFNAYIMNLFFTQNPSIAPSILKWVLLVAIFIYTLYIIICNVIANKVLKLGVNVD